MATIGELKARLQAKGYAATTSPTLPVTVFTHPLITAPVVLIGLNNSTAKPYEIAAVTAAETRR